jgi:ABC-type transport system involved in cytochrome c biogenesis permease subunit
MDIRNLLIIMIKSIKYLIHISMALCCYLIFISIQKKDFQVAIFVVSMFIVNIFAFLFLNLILKEFDK